MNHNEIIFLCLAGTAVLCFGLVNGIQFLLKHNKTAQTVGTILSVSMPNPATAQTRNSKWAIVSYKVNGQTYQSRNRIQVPMTSQIGSTVKVRYDKLNPEKLYSFSVLHIVVSFAIAAGCFFIAGFRL